MNILSFQKEKKDEYLERKKKRKRNEVHKGDFKQIWPFGQGIDLLECFVNIEYFIITNQIHSSGGMELIQVELLLIFIVLLLIYMYL